MFLLFTWLYFRSQWCNKSAETLAILKPNISVPSVSQSITPIEPKTRSVSQASIAQTGHKIVISIFDFLVPKALLIDGSVAAPEQWDYLEGVASGRKWNWSWRRFSRRLTVCFWTWGGLCRRIHLVIYSKNPTIFSWPSRASLSSIRQDSNVGLIRKWPIFFRSPLSDCTSTTCCKR